MSSDFDEIFGDLKEDQHAAPSLTTDFDADSIFGDAALSGSTKPNDESVPEKPRDASVSPLTVSSPPPAPVASRVEQETSFSIDEQPADTAPSASAGSGEQDDFLSWLDDAPKPGAVAVSVNVEKNNPQTSVMQEPQPVLTSSTAEPSGLMETVSLDDEPSASSPVVDDMMVPVIQVATPAVDDLQPTAETMAPVSDEISLDDDDDDDYLEKIVQSANKKQQAGSREASSSSLAIKSRSQVHEPQIDAKALLQTYLETGTVPPASRLPLWKFCVQEPTKGEPLSMYALQTTALDLPNQALLRKDVESLCAAVFASQTLREVLDAAAESDEMDGARLLFLDSVEILVTHLCKTLKTDYTPGLALTFAPLLAAGGSDPLRLELVDTLRGVCHRFLPHLGHQTACGGEQVAASVKLARIAAARRELLKQLLLYHAPALARHLEHHFPAWNSAVKDSRSSNSGGGAIPDAWVASFFESERYGASFDFLVKVWDCCLLLGPALGSSGSTSNCQHMASFVTIHLVIHTEKALIRMEGDQLRHCMAQTLVEALKDEHNGLLQGVRALVESTPPSFIARLHDAVNAMSESVADAECKVQVPSPTSSPAVSTNNGLAAMSSLLTASANGVKELSTAMIDMPAKLLAIGPIKPLSLSGLGLKNDDGVAGQSAQELFFLHAQALDVQPAVMPLATGDVIPHVFRSFQSSSPAPTSAPTLRYFIVDCRAKVEDGQVPTAFRIDPDNEDPNALEVVMSTLLPLKHSAHFAVMGAGYAQIANELRQLPEHQQQQYQEQQAADHHSADASAPFAFNESFLEALACDQRRVRATVELLTAQGFSKVSVLDGGFACAHALLRHSLEFATADLVDHDASRCAMCAHHDRFARVRDGGRSKSGASNLNASGVADPSSLAVAVEMTSSTTLSFSTANGQVIDNRNSSRSSSASAKTASARTASGGLDAKALFDSHASSPSSTPSPKYLSSFAGALKTGGKTLLNPADSLKESTKWLMKKSSGESTANSTTSPIASGGGSGSPAVTLGIGGLSKLRNSLVHIGSESIDMLRKAEQAATAKSRLPFGSPSSSSNAGKPPSGQPGHASASTRTASGSAPHSSASTSAGSVGRSAPGADRDRNASFQPSEEEVFTIDDDEEEEQDDFVGGGGGSHASSSSASSLRNGSFQRDGSVPDGAAASFVLHDVVKGHVGDLRKGMRVSRTQMLPCVESPFFSGYKKKKVGDKPVMLPRRLVLVENHLMVLKAERGADDVYLVKSSHPLAHLARMTCLKKNALMVTVYHKWKPSEASDFVERRNAYEVQQRDEFIRAIKTAMDKM